MLAKGNTESDEPLKAKSEGEVDETEGDELKA